jgi:hypothetical protein
VIWEDAAEEDGNDEAAAGDESAAEDRTVDDVTDEDRPILEDLGALDHRTLVLRPTGVDLGLRLSTELGVLLGVRTGVELGATTTKELNEDAAAAAARAFILRLAIKVERDARLARRASAASLPGQLRSSVNAGLGAAAVAS